MEQKTKDSLKIILDLYKTDRLSEEGAFVLLESIFDNNKTTYYPITIPETPNPWVENPWDRKIWYETTTTTWNGMFNNENKDKEENE